MIKHFITGHRRDETLHYGTQEWRNTSLRDKRVIKHFITGHRRDETLHYGTNEGQNTQLRDKRGTKHFITGQTRDKYLIARKKERRNNSLRDKRGTNHFITGQTRDETLYCVTNERRNIQFWLKTFGLAISRYHFQYWVSTLLKIGNNLWSDIKVKTGCYINRKHPRTIDGNKGII